MKKLVIAAAASAFLATPAFAQVLETETVDITASVPQVCTWEAPGELVIGEIPVNTVAGPDALKITSAKESDLTVKWASCNVRAKLTVTTANAGRGLESPTLASTTAPVGFVKSIPYQLTGPTTSAVLGMAGGGYKQFGASEWWNTPFAFHTQLNYRARVSPSAVNNLRPLAANDYQDTVTITLTAL